jgi:hypothetical protein
MAASGIPDGWGEWPGGDEPAGGSIPADHDGAPDEAPDEAGPKSAGAAWADKTGGSEGGGAAPGEPSGGGPTRGGSGPPGNADRVDKPDASSRDGRVDYLQPLSNDLIAAVLDAQGYRYFTDSDGDIGGRWDDHMIYFFRFGSKGDLLQVRILVGNTFTTNDVPRLYAFCNEWNHDRLWPKAYVHVYDDGVARVCGEVMADLKTGVAFDQLTQLIECGIETGLHMADAVAELQDA